MEILEKREDFFLARLDKEICKKYSEKILELLKNIPNTDYKISDIFTEQKGSRVLYGKWEHSLAVFCNGELAGILVGYEREKEGNSQYPENCFYINELSVSEKYQGYGFGKHLVKSFLDNCRSYKHLSGDVIFKIQTTDLESNKKVIDFYKSMGFEITGRKKYPEKYDLIMELRR